MRRPLRRDGEYIGPIVAAITTDESFKAAPEMGKMFGSRIFALYGGDRVPTHPDLVSGHPSRSVKDPVVPLDRVGDPVLARIDQAVPVQILEFGSQSDAEMLQLSVDDVLYLVVRKSLQQFGDTVNAAQRLEGLGKGVAPDTEVTILISSTTRSQLPVEFTRAAVGSHLVKGKAERIDVYQLLEQEAET